MNKSILVLAAVAAAAVNFFSAPSVEARGLRFGIGFAPAFGAQFNRADPTILQRASEANQRIIARERAMAYGSRTVVVSRPSISAQKAAEAREARRQAAAAKAKAERLAAATEAKRLARTRTIEKATLARAQLPAAAAATAAAAVAAPVAATVVSQPAPVETKPVATPVSVNAAAPIDPAPVATTPAAATPAKAASTAECIRFIPGAGVTVKVSCTE